jgi:hypothetical protein
VILGLIVTPITPEVSGLEAVAMGGLGSGIVFALLGGLTGRPGLFARQITIMERLHWSGQRALRVGAGSGCIISILGALGVMLFVGAAGERIGNQAGGMLVGLVYGLGIGLLFGPILGFFGGLIAGAIGGLEGGDVEKTTRPNQGIRRSGRTGALVGGGVGLLLGLLAGLPGGPVAGLFVAISIGLPLALAYGGYTVLSHLVLRFLLWRSGVMPWNYASFLDNASERAFLRKIGGGYIFIHRLLLEHFADSEAAPPEARAVLAPAARATH